ncbi:recombinase family protein [Rhodanobacter sp. FW106-PBR-R2A-1-13]|uniref:recombinase family protein n=1 Tax=Rhodanobacter sp. FW106-PBR-R2A-1-13 TaxID=3454845 RepID=UPI0034E4C1D1
MAKAYAYIRWSTDAQSEGDSLTRQTAGLDTFKASYPDAEVVRNYVDEGVSSFKGKNRISGELATMLEAVAKGHIRSGDYIVCESIDRLTREGWEVATDLIRGFVKKGINLYTTFDKRLYVSSRLEDFLMIGLIAERAKNESETKSIRIKEAWKRRTANTGKTLFQDKAPFGLSIVDGQYQVNEKEKAEIEELLEVIALSGVNKGISIVNRYSTYRWNKAKVHALLSKKWILGIHSRTANIFTDVVESGEVIGKRRKQQIVETTEGFYPQVVSKLIFDRAVRAMEARSFQKEGGRRSTNFNNVFNKTIFCHNCREALFYQQAKNPNHSKNEFIRIFHCPNCRWQMPFDVAFYEFLYFVMLSGIGASNETTESHRGGVGGRLTSALSQGKERQAEDLEKLETAYYQAVEDEQALSIQVEGMDIFPIPKIIIQKIKQVSERVASTKKAFEMEKARATDIEITLDDFVEKMTTERGRLELNAIIRSLEVSSFFQFNKEGGTGYVTIEKDYQKIWYREYQYGKTSKGTRAKAMVEKFGFDVIDLMEGRGK